MSSKIRVFEVGPRDGLQNQSQVLSVEERVRTIELLVAAGLEDIEVGSFVRADRIPQLKDTHLVLKHLARLKRQRKNLRFWAFVPNLRGLEEAIEAGVDGVGLFAATSNTFCVKNVNRTQHELFDELAHLLPRARKAGVKARVYLSTISYCPYEGPISVAQTRRAVKVLTEMKAPQIALGDTTGHSTPLQIRKLLTALLRDWSPKLFAVHLHDTRALALANAWEAMKLGITHIDASMGGLGGCPYAPGAAGNLATEDLLYMLQHTGTLGGSVSLEAVSQASLYLEEVLKTSLPSKVLRTLVPKQGV